MLKREWTYVSLYQLNTTSSMFKLVQVVVKQIRVFLMYCEVYTVLYLPQVLEVQPQTASNTDPRFVSLVTGSSHEQH
jgi:hypothetical protein